MSLGENLVFLRKMRNQMTQEELAEKIGVSRQTVSKWEINDCYPEMSKVIELCKFFSCSMDDLVQNDMNVCDVAFSNIRVEEIKPFKYVKYEVVSSSPEEDAFNHLTSMAGACGIKEPKLIGWDFPVLSQEQINVYHMHGYVAAWILPEGFPTEKLPQVEVIQQRNQEYVAITIKDPFSAPFHLIPNAYKTLFSHMKVNQLSVREPEGVISCFEKDYVVDEITYMDVFIAICRE